VDHLDHMLDVVVCHIHIHKNLGRKIDEMGLQPLL
jgi:hypothetical protein